MSMKFVLQPFDPCPPADQGLLDQKSAQDASLLAIEIQTKYQFLDEQGEVYHEYSLPSNADIHNCGGYVDKLMKYRDPGLFQYLLENGVSKDSLMNGPYPLLRTRSPQLDLALVQLIQHIRREFKVDTVGLFDHGCSVAEHWDLIDVMIRAATKSSSSAADIVRYCGLDRSSLLLTAAKYLHAGLSERQFRLVPAEGSSFTFPENHFDLSVTVGVVNHVVDPKAALANLLKVTRYGSVFAVWSTQDANGFWGVTHRGQPIYFFSKKDFADVADMKGNGRFWVIDYIPEAQSSQQKSYIGLGNSTIERMGCYHLVYSTLGTLPFPVVPLIA